MRKNWLGIIVLVLVNGIVLVGKIDAQTDNRLNGTWVKDDFELRLQNGNFETIINNIPSIRGIYTTNNGELIFKLSHISGNAMNINIKMSILEDKWYTSNEFVIAFRTFALKQNVPEAQVNDMVNKMVNKLLNFIPPFRYSVDNTSLIRIYIDERGKSSTDILMKR